MKFSSLLTAISAGVLLSACQTTTADSNENQVAAPQASNVVAQNTVAAKNDVTTPKYEEFLGSGDALPLAEIVDVEGNKVDLSSPDKKKLVILFATWCSDSNRALKALNKSPLLQDDSIEIIAIAREQDDETVKAWRDKHEINVPLASDPDRAIFKQFAAAGIPRMITVSQDNQIIKMNLAEGENQLALIHW